jgi:hypothetical protein
VIVDVGNVGKVFAEVNTAYAGLFSFNPNASTTSNLAGYTSL